jgi:hypothetical protein
MVVFALGRLAYLETLIEEVNDLGYDISIAGCGVEFEGHKEQPDWSKKIVEYVELVKFDNDAMAAQFVLTYGDKYSPRSTEQTFKPGIRRHRSFIQLIP